jgi:hypothetical protein
MAADVILTFDEGWQSQSTESIIKFRRALKCVQKTHTFYIA